MKISTILFAFVASIALAACSSEPAPANAAEPAATEAKPETGTSISVGEGGVAIESKDGSVNVSTDSARIDLNPK